MPSNMNKYLRSLLFFLLLPGFLPAMPAFAKNPAAGNQAERNDMLAAASVENGHTISLTCGVCHTFDKGGPDQTGPNLFGIVGARHAHEKTYHYSSALQRMTDRIWTTDALDKWLKGPGSYAPGTTMNFGGLLDPQDRADVIAYLMTLK
jgi:cytochrome c